MHNFPRLSGLGLVFFGAVLTKFSTWDVLQAARSGAESVSYSMKFVMVSLVLLELGLVMLALGPAYYHWFHRGDDRSKLTPLGFLLVVLLLVPAFGGYGWLESQLALLGYSKR
jgi:uncharacterized membrane protein YidH (DUF202 family)